MTMKKLSSLECLPSEIVIYSITFLTLFIAIYIAFKFIFKRTEGLEGKWFKFLNSSSNLISTLVKVLVIFCADVFVYGIVFFILIVIFVWSMKILFNISANSKMFSILASPLATIVGLSFTIFIAMVGNKILSLNKVKEWIKNLMEQINSVINDFINLNTKITIPLIVVLFWFELVFGFKLKFSNIWTWVLLILLLTIYLFIPHILPKLKNKKHSKQ